MASPTSRPAGAHDGRGLDYTSPPSGGGAYLKAHGYEAVARYVSPQSWKRLTKAEVADYKKNGIALLLNFESAANNAAKGFNQGVIDAHSFLSVAESLGLTGKLTGYFSVDWDVTTAQMPAVLNYFRGIVSVMGKAFVGAYGSYRVIRALQSAGTITYYWQTYAWSGGQVAAGIHWYQYSNGHNVGGADADLNQIFTTPDKWGAYGATASPIPTPSPTVEDDDMHYQTLAVGENFEPTTDAYLRNGGVTRYAATVEFGDADLRVVCMVDGSWKPVETHHVKSTDIPLILCDADRMVEKISITRTAQAAPADGSKPSEGVVTITTTHVAG